MRNKNIRHVIAAFITADLYLFLHCCVNSHFVLYMRDIHIDGRGRIESVRKHSALSNRSCKVLANGL